MRDTRQRLHAGQDWSEAWYSEADAGLAQPWASDLERQPLDEIAALEQFPSELAEVPAPPPHTASGLASGPRHDRPPALARHPRTLVAAGGVGTLLLSFFVMGLRPEPERSFRRDVYLPDLRVEAPAAAAAGEPDPGTTSRRSTEPARSTSARNAGPASPRGAARQSARDTSNARAEGRSAGGAMRAPLAAPLPAGRTASAGRSTSPPLASGRMTGAGPSAPSLSAAGRTAGAGRSAPPPSPAPIAEGIRLSQAVEPPTRSFAISPAESGAVATESAPDPPRVPAPTPADPSAASPPVPPPPTDRQVINGVLEQYRAALNRLDAGAMKAVWPALDAGAAARAFSQLERQAVSFNGCSIAIYGDDATARCQGRASYVPRVGPRDERVADRQWRIELRKAAGDWRIVEVEAR